MDNYIKTIIKFTCICLGSLLFYSCSTQKDNATNRALQNLSARYNFIYNSNVLLETYQDDLSQTNADKYDHILAVYIAPASIDYLNASSSAINQQTLDEIAQKAQVIISDKGLSNYVDEAYMLLAKTNFYKGNYFSATAYFDYVAKAYQGDKKIFVNAMNWKARSLMQLNEDQRAVEVLDTIRTNLDSLKKNKAEPLATLAQMSIFQQDYKKAISYLESALKESKESQQKVRWAYILAQLYENEKQYEQSLRNYTRVEKSNAPFEMYFNAKLSKIRISDQLSSQTSNRREQLLKLLKDDKNFDYTDQVYYEVAEDYFAHQNYAKAEEYYKLSAQKSIQNPYQKGLSYLKLADLSFKSLGNYVNAKLYYDSASITLPKTYPGYESILKKSQNLEYLTERYQQIAIEDTLQTIARLPKQERESRMDKMFANAQKAAADLKNNPQATNVGLPVAVAPSKSQNATAAFYFSNLDAMSIGFNDFKRRWGSRPLEDNWRQSVKSSAQLNQQNQANITDPQHSGSATAQNATNLDKATQIAAFEATLPLTTAALKASNEKIIAAYFEIAGFYQQVLGDQNEAIKVYETLLARYPENNHLEAIYYSLYLGYAQTNREKSEQFKNLILRNYPSSVYAKTILDPNFSTKQNALDLAINKAYNSVFESYQKKDFANVIKIVDETNQRFPGNNLQAQYDYLKAIAIGRTSHVDSLLKAFQTILVNYPNDQLISPLVKDHLAYINDHLSTFKARKIALIDFDPTEPRFINQQHQAAAQPQQDQQTINPTVVEPKTVVVLPPTKDKPAAVNSMANTAPPSVMPDSIAKAPAVNKLFTKDESSTYYYVISVNDVSVSVSSSRFGVGQFNRGNYPGTGIKHQLLELDEDQLIFVGNFNTLSEVITYAEGITPQLPKIMKVPAANYKWFYISKENLDKIKNRNTLNQYLEFFKNNFNNK